MSLSSQYFVKGRERELKASKSIHSKGLPVLLSAQVLRSYECGQVDVAVVKKSTLRLYEVKSLMALSFKQRVRLKRSASFLADLLELNVSLSLTRGKLDDL